MIKRKLLVVFSVFLILCAQITIKAQSIVPILLNEYSASNIGTPVDNFGQQSDWVEIRNAHTQQVDLTGYYLSNDRNNLLKWKFPPGFVMGVETYKVVWLSGKNTVANDNFHANFTLDQCRNQWLILTSPSGVVRDSVFVQKAKAGHSWGRVDPAVTGVNAWRLYTSNSFLYPNPIVNNYIGYTPKPFMVATPPFNSNTSANASGINAGGFCSASAIIYFKDGPLRYDTIFHPCYNIFFTLDGSYPLVGSPNTFQIFDSLNPVLTLSVATVIRAISVINPTANCSQSYLPSFCETNTYFTDTIYKSFKSEFGVLSISIDPQDSSWFSSNGLPANTMIHAEYFDHKMQVSEGYGLLNRPSNESWKTAQKGFNITIDDNQGFGCNFEGNIFNVDGLGASSRTVFPTLQVYGGDIESASAPLTSGTATVFGTGIRDVFMQSLAAKYNLKVNPLHVKPVVVFKNGTYWGVFTLKEVYDKYYENYYNHQSKDSLDLAFYHNTDGYVSYPDGSISRFSPNTAFKSEVYNIATVRPLGATSSYYRSLANALDLPSIIDYMAVNSYAMNSDLWNYNIAYAKGGQTNQPGSKWHYYLWNMPAIFNFTALATNTLSYNTPFVSPCSIYSSTYAVSPVQTGNGHGAIVSHLMNPITGNPDFQTQYKNRYQDLMNTAFKCENILKHFDYIDSLYSKEMHYAEALGTFSTTAGTWDTNMTTLRRVIAKRCDYMATAFKTSGCYGLAGPFDLTINVDPAGAGVVKLNSIILDSYPWTAQYFGESSMSLKAIPTNSTYAFHHWDIKNNTVLNSRPKSLDSLAISFGISDEITAIFTDKSKDLSTGGDEPNVPTGFTPNGDGRNDTFGPLGSAYFTNDYEMTIWNRWGQEVFRSLDPNQQWDGNFHGQQSITGVYAFVIKYKNIYGEDKLLKGNVTLTR